MIVKKKILWNIVATAATEQVTSAEYFVKIQCCNQRTDKLLPVVHNLLFLVRMAKNDL